VRNIEFPAGLCLRVLSVAAKHAHPALAVSVFDELAKISVTWDERHFLPLIDAYVRAGDIRQAFIVLNIMRERSATPPTIRSIQTLIQALTKDTKALDTAYFILEDIAKQEGQVVDLVAFNSLLQACVGLQDASRAVATYREFEKFGVTPDLETYNILLRAVKQVAHIDLMMAILQDMKAAGLSPNEETFTNVILTCVLSPPPQHETAFPYLEEMKAHGYVPSAGVYKAFIKKCIFANDDRAYALLDEMRNMGHETTLIERWIGATTPTLSGGAWNKFREFQLNRVARMRTPREEDRQATQAVFSTLGGNKNADDRVGREVIEKIKEQGLIA
jgi:pentatricopeptide repeat protein